MRLSPFFLLATSATAFRLPHPANAILDARALDPTTMDPTQFSVLSVLKEAMPTGPNPPLPTGDSDPAWYQNLPLDVKELLPKFYPVVQAVAVTAEESSTSSAASSSASEPTTTASESTSARISSTAAATTGNGNGNGTVSSTQLSSAATTSASPSDSDSLTTTSLASPSATSTGSNSNNGTTRTTSRISDTPPAATARPSIPSSAGSRTFEQVPLEAVIAAWIGVAVGFAVFA